MEPEFKGEVSKIGVGQCKAAPDRATIIDEYFSCW